ncbi:Geranylgeranyl transferase type-1 subunit beta [Komagataella phaffii CBS 7435]|uniref:Beta subunit of geranylgeranyltransferase type I n=2 Tax=Komagataella phaffii TaxID=460519 RepID=C4R8Y5_KOMPG|nr:Beta subunit of geranylgeranyltransferase type I [Komagataella phaffii GS115]AOA64538.1 GQ67_05182T0 [Komagataella phaffii]CAH2450531.1 Geranylgeranyl transferase type-1 subunit beta [Komagataella phaffii CBS 7435]AOA69532.1 GQ68_05164T0 [Komagataella phaffii GS115]CAY72060.1 Beta subunit of geranylgeranyltransferase type I [Komagataella phaffii GS115]CCA40335.1 Geranylgeranyl transferase type-1 subunit beta [Komagataella phaffii CBS 7435]
MSLDASKHVKYFQLCLDMLPSRFEEEDSNKLAIVYFSLLGLLLLRDKQSEDIVNINREEKIEWIYKHYLPDKSGFRGSLLYDLQLNQPKDSTNSNEYDVPNMAATLFSLQILYMFKDKRIMDRLDKNRIMSFVSQCQTEDGSFKSCLGRDGIAFGDSDLRHCMIACTIRRILSGCETTTFQDDINVEKLKDHIMQCLNYNGGLGGSPNEESHAGLTFCGLASLKLLGAELNPNEWRNTIRWLCHRQIQSQSGDDNNGGFNGRENKSADTCYSFWVIGSLKLFNMEHLIDQKQIKQYLITVTQNKFMGGFTKTSEVKISDPLHSSLALCTLSILGFPGLAQLDLVTMTPL